MAYNDNYVKGTTPIGKAFYAFLEKPSVYNGIEQGYEVQLMLSKEETDELLETIEKEWEAYKEANPKNNYKRCNPNFAIKETDDGDVLFKFKAKHKYEYKGETVTRTTPIFDAEGKPLKNVIVGNNSEIKVAFTLVPYYVSSTVCGVRLQMDAVQIIVLKEYHKGGTAETFGFGVVEGGFKGTDKEDNDENPFVDNMPDCDEDEDGDF